MSAATSNPDEAKITDVETVLELLRKALDRAHSGSPSIFVLTGEGAAGAALTAQSGFPPGVRPMSGDFSRHTPHVGLGPLPRIVAWLAEERRVGTDLDRRPRWMRAAVDDVLGHGDEPRDLAEIYAAVADLIEAGAPSPLVLILHDVHRAGHGFSNFLTFLGTRRIRRALLIVCTAPGDFPAEDLWPQAEVVRVEAGEAHEGIDARDGEGAPSALADGFEGRTQPELVGALFERAGATQEAAEWLARAGHLSFQRADMPAAADLLSRAAGFLPTGDRTRLSALAASCDALLAIGRPDLVVETARNALDEARAAGDACMVARFSMWMALMGLPSTTASLADQLGEVARVLSRCDDAVGRAHVEEARAHLQWDEGDLVGSVSSMHEALSYARAGRDRPTTSRIVVWLLDRSLAGPAPVPETTALCTHFEWVADWSALVDVKRLVVGAAAAAAAGNRGAAQARLAEAEALQARLGQPGWVARLPQLAAWMDLVEGDGARAAERLADVYAELRDVGHPVAVETGILLSRALTLSARFDDAAAVASECLARAETPSGGEPWTRGEALAARARARVGSTGVLAEALASLPPEPFVIRRADALLDLAWAASALGDTDRARGWCEEAIGLYDAKRARACVDRAQKALADFARQV